MFSLKCTTNSLGKRISVAFAGGLTAAAILIAPLETQSIWPNGSEARNSDEASARDTLPLEGQGEGRTNASLTDALRDAGTLYPAEPFHYRGNQIDRSRAAKCLAAAAWYEAGDDPVGQHAVIQTVVNRVNHPSFPNSFCGVVFEGSELPTGCQFTFTCDGSLKRRQPSASAWRHALVLSQKALSGEVYNRIGTATHYHADYVNPWWSGELEKVTTVGQHIFYRWAGDIGWSDTRRNLASEQDYDSLVEKSISNFDASRLGYEQEVESAMASAEANSIVAAPNIAPYRVEKTVFLALEIGEANGRWALSAMAACKTKPDCQVLGYSGEEEITLNKPRAAANRDRPLFIFVRDAASSMAIALWDCQRVERPKKSECLPLDKPALANLMRDRS